MPRGKKQPGRGTLGGRKNSPARSAKQVTRRKRHLAEPRVSKALEKARQERAFLDAQADAVAAIRRQGRSVPHVHSDPPVLVGNPPRYACCGALVPPEPVAEPQPAPSPARSPKVPVRVASALPLDSNGNGAWTLGQARSMLRQGYTLAHVVNATGWGTKWLSDLPLDEEGRGVSTQKWLEDHH